MWPMARYVSCVTLSPSCSNLTQDIDSPFLDFDPSDLERLESMPAHVLMPQKRRAFPSGPMWLEHPRMTRSKRRLKGVVHIMLSCLDAWSPSPQRKVAGPQLRIIPASYNSPKRKPLRIISAKCRLRQRCLKLLPLPSRCRSLSLSRY